jgi:hypothetical protein
MAGKSRGNAMSEAPSRISPFNAKDTQESVIKSRLALAAAAKKLKRSLPVTIKTEYLDDDAWVELAQARGWHLPQKNTRASSAGVAPWLRRLGLDKPKFRIWCGYNPVGWCKQNPTWSLRALVGLLLEDFGSEVGNG